VGALSVPTFAMAGASASFAASNMYLWRGQNLAPHGGAISGSLDYGFDNGIYAGVWGSGEEAGHEFDLYFGYGGEAAGVSYDISYWSYNYPEERTSAGIQTDLGDTDFADVIVSVGYGPVTFAAYVSVDNPSLPSSTDDKYFTLTGEWGKISATYGWWDLEFPASGDEYTHVTLGYAATDEISFAVNFAMSDLNDDSGVEEDPLFQVTYSKSFDL
ncbi:MAG: hypothetical protein GXP19_00820, partial [Gammaproteobacteria bacterium]|nr:hypothetical protein [Gammaproteobacteria bacterium]